MNANDIMVNQHGKVLPWEDYLYDKGKGDNLVNGHSSHNVPLIAGVLGLMEAQSDHRVWSDWYDYFTKPWMTGETASRHIYGSWINGSVLAAWAIAKAKGRGALEVPARLHLRATAAWLALGAAGLGTGEYGRSFITCTGARSGASQKDENGNRFDESGYANPIWYLEYNNLESLLDVLLGHQPQLIKTWLDSKYATDPPVRRHGLFYDRVRVCGTGTERSVGGDKTYRRNCIPCVRSYTSYQYSHAVRCRVLLAGGTTNLATWYEMARGETSAMASCGQCSETQSRPPRYSQVRC
jgi:hypothetical protein